MEDKFSRKQEWLMAISVPIFFIILWFVLRPETFYQRIVSIGFGVFLLAFIWAVSYFNEKKKAQIESN